MMTNLAKFFDTFGINPSEITDEWWEQKYLVPVKEKQERKKFVDTYCEPGRMDSCLNCGHLDMRTRSTIGYTCIFLKNKNTEPIDYKRQPWDKPCTNFIKRIVPVSEYKDTIIKDRIKKQHVCETCACGSWRTERGICPRECAHCNVVDNWQAKGE